ncbi:MAG: hypothetical protein AAFX58_03835 [Pseudomonadota bacterium]
MTRLLAIGAAAALATGAGTALADNHEQHGPTVRPVEIYTCNYNDGRDREDLDRVVERWNRYMDENDDTGYVAFALTPNFVSAFDFDIGWMGFAPDTKAFGQSLQNWRASGGELAQAFAEVLTCGAHANFASMNIIEPPEEVPEQPVITFTDCTVNDDSSFEAAMEGVHAWAEFVQSAGVGAPFWLWFPAYGEASDATYHFKWVTAFSDYNQWADDWELYGNGSGWQKAEELFDGVMHCDSGRVYNLELLRRPAGG